DCHVTGVQTCALPISILFLANTEYSLSRCVVVFLWAEVLQEIAEKHPAIPYPMGFFVLVIGHNSVIKKCFAQGFPLFLPAFRHSSEQRRAGQESSRAW